MHFPVLGTGYSQHLQSSTETDSAFLSPEPEYPCPTDVMGAGNCGKGLFSRGRIAQPLSLSTRETGLDASKKDELLAQGYLKEFVDASEPNEVNLARHINHSCDPNAVVELWNDPNGLPRALVISKRTIFPGEEITIHYGSDFMPSPCLCEKCIQGVTSSSAGGKASNTEIPLAHDGLRGPSFGELDNLASFSNEHHSIRIRRQGCEEEGDIVISFDFQDLPGQIDVKKLNSPV
ncbi:hypothetical protein B0H14DRAFT_2645285 [Mycena olivaceomarginata]|nr:hypothetical protein B0H14DRAFT_2645285 [Mycena olivaceomarginata]